jgi:G2/mitotic-specific cyclin-B, other
LKPAVEKRSVNDNAGTIRVELAPAPNRPHAYGTRSQGAVSDSYQHSGQVDDIDARDAEDPLCATNYVMDMYEHFREREFITSVRPTFMENQRHINERMRSILIDWLVEVHLKFKLVPETLYLTVNLIDRFLEKEEVSRPKLQLVGVTSLLIASKYEEIYPPELRDLVYICDRAYTRNEVSTRLNAWSLF